MTENILELKNITKRFAGVTALNNVSLSLKPGEILALVGENGAGKSTLIKVITGAHQPSEGEMYFNGELIENNSPSKAKSLGIEAIYQEQNLMQDLKVYENVFYQNEIKKGLFIDDEKMISECQRLIDSFGIDINPQARVKTLSVAAQQLVEIIKAVRSNYLKVLIMDEPTASLTESEIEKMFEIVERLKKQGVAILYISHRLEEIFEIADRVTVIRDGEHIIDLDIEDASIPMLIRYMVGRDLAGSYPERESKIGETILEVKNLSNRKLRNCSFHLNKQEILGIGGLVGAGRTELVRAIFGADPIRSGEIFYKGEKLDNRNPSKSIKNGFALITEDRKSQGLFLNKSINFNISYSSLEKVSSNCIINSHLEETTSQKFGDYMNIRAYSYSQLCKTLSGGNQQKVVLAKWLATDAEVFIFDEPTRGIDVGAKAEIYQLMRRLSEQGKSIIMISSEMPELIGMCDRIIVMQNGGITGELDKDEFSQERILELAALKEVAVKIDD